MRSRRLSLPPSLRIDAQLEMLSSKTPGYGTCWYYFGIYTVLNRTMVLDNRTGSVGLKEDLIL